MFVYHKYAKTNEHIYFFETKSYYNSSIPTNNTDTQTLYLFNSRYNIDFFQIIPRNFKIIAEDTSYFFNIDIIKDTSKIINDLHFQNTDSFELFSSNYDYEVLSKFEQLYQGNTISINKKEMKQYNIFRTHLKIDCIPKLSKENFYSNDKIYIQMEKNSFINYIKKLAPRSFTISTKKSEYKCNVFGILFSDVLLAYVTNYPDENSFYFDFDDENNEFAPICSLFNFEYVKITANNIDSLKEIAEELHIKCILDDINENFNGIDKISQLFDKHQDTVDSIEELFESLFGITKETVLDIQETILSSSFVKTEEGVQELAAFILQVVRNNFQLHQNLANLLISLNKSSKKEKHLNNLIPFIIDKLLANFGKDQHECSFIFVLSNNGFISNKMIIDKLNEMKSKSDIDFLNVITWFMPEVSQITQIDEYLVKADKIQKEWIQSYYPSNFEQYKKMRDCGEPDDALTVSLRHDDINKFQAIITFNNFDLSKGTIPYNMYEDFIENGKTNYIDYAAAYGSVRCFKYLLLNGQKIGDLTFTYAVYGGNTEIIRIIYQNIKSFSKDSDTEKKTIISTIQRHQNNLFDWIFEQIYLPNDCDPELLMDLLILSADNGNAHSLIEIIENGHPFDSADEQRTGWGFYQSRNNLKYSIESSAKNGFYTITKILYDIIKERNELFIIRNITPYTQFGNLLILKTISNSIQVQNKYGNDIKQNNEWFIESVKNNNLNIIDYYLRKQDSKLGIVDDNTIMQCLKYCYTENHANMFKSLSSYLTKKSSKWMNNIVSEILPEECKEGNYYSVLNIVNLVSNSKYIYEYDITKSFLNATISGSKKICNLLLNSNSLLVYFDELLNYVDEISKIDKEFFVLIYKNSSYKTKRKYLQNLLYPAIINGNTKLVKYLLKSNADFEDSLFYAVNSHSIEMVNTILDHCDTPDFINKISNDGTALCVAAKNQDLDILSRLLSIPGIDPSLHGEEENTPLLIAIKNKDIDIAKTIIDFNCEKIEQWEFDNCINQLFDFYNGNNDVIVLSVVDFLIKKIVTIKNVNLNFVYNNNDSILFYAIDNNDTNFVKTLLELEGINPNIYTVDKKNTPLMISIKKLSIEIAETFIKNPKTNINQRNYHKKTALVMAVKRNLYNLIDMLISHKKFSRRESNSKKAFAISNTESLKHLIKIKSLDVNALINNKTTKLIEATNNQDLEMINLIMHHRSFNKEQSKLEKAFEIALNSGYEDIIKKFIPLLDDVSKYKVNDKDLLSITQNFSSSEEIIKLIIENPSFDAKKFDLNKAIHIAKTKNNNAIITQLESEKNKLIEQENKAKSKKSDHKSRKVKHNQSETDSNKIKSNQSESETNQSNTKKLKTKSAQSNLETSQSNTKNIKTKSTQPNLETNQPDTKNIKTKSAQSELIANKNKSKQTEIDQVKTKSDQTKPNQNKSKQSNSSKIKPNQSELKTIKMSQTDMNQNQIKPSQSTNNQIKATQSNSTQRKPKSNQTELKMRSNKPASTTTKNKVDQIKLFNGIVSHLKTKFNNTIERAIKITCSSCFNFSEFQPQNVINYEDQNKSFWSKNSPNNWLCFEFINNRIILSCYRIRSCNLAKNCSHPKSWVIEGTNDNNEDKKWSIIDQVENCPFLNGPGLIHLFRIPEQEKLSFHTIRMRVTDIDWYGTNCLMIESFEIFGTLLKRPK